MRSPSSEGLKPWSLKILPPNMAMGSSQVRTDSAFIWAERTLKSAAFKAGLFARTSETSWLTSSLVIINALVDFAGSIPFAVSRRKKFRPKIINIAEYFINPTGLDNSAETMRQGLKVAGHTIGGEKGIS